MLCMSVLPPEELCAAAGWIAAIASSPSCPSQLHVAETSQGLGQLSWRQLPLQGSLPYNKAVTGGTAEHLPPSFAGVPAALCPATLLCVSCHKLAVMPLPSSYIFFCHAAAEPLP